MGSTRSSIIKLLRKYLLIFALVLFLIIISFSVPINTKQGLLDGTEGLCMYSEPETIRHSFLLGGQKSYQDTVLTAFDEAYGSFDGPGLSLCGKYETHRLYIL